MIQKIDVDESLRTIAFANTIAGTTMYNAIKWWAQGAGVRT